VRRGIHERQGAEVLVADYQSQPLEGEPGSVTIVINFPSMDAARAWYDSPEYRNIVDLRTDNGEGVVLLADGFAMPR